MNALLLLFVLVAAAQVADDPAPGPKAAPKDSALVQASRDNGGPRKKKARKVITNADVKRSKGKLVVLPQRPEVTSSAEPPASDKGLLEQQDDSRKARREAEKRLADADARVKDLERELARIEQSYYDESDPNRRDSAITARFLQTKRQLDDARKDLADARDAYSRAGGDRS